MAKKYYENIVNKFYDFASAPIYATIVTVMLFMAAFYASLYTTEIKSAFPVYGFPDYWNYDWNGLNSFAVKFWILLIVSSLLFLVNQRATNKQREVSENNLIERTNKLEQLIRTLPPEDFLGLFYDIHSRCYKALSDIIRAYNFGDKDLNLELYIRFFLYNILAVIKRFEANPTNPIFAANIMLFHRVDSFDTDSFEKLRAKLRFIQPDVDLMSNDGFLLMRCDLSATSESEDLTPDESINDIAFPIPKVRQSVNGTRSRVLPGAPFAFCENTIVTYGNTQDLTNWCRQYGDFPESIIGEIDDYFRNEGRNIKSFASIPLSSTNSGDLFGVLNIHSNGTDLVLHREVAKYLWPFIKIITYFLADLVELLLLLESQLEGTGPDVEESIDMPPEDQV